MTTPVTSRTTSLQLLDLGQSIWLDNIQRSMLTSGRLASMIEAGWITGMTSNPTIFEKAIAGSSDYDSAITAIAGQGELSPYDAFVSIAAQDVQGAADHRFRGRFTVPNRRAKRGSGKPAEVH